jgi:PAS domain S-box-containing protein
MNAYTRIRHRIRHLLRSVSLVPKMLLLTLGVGLLLTVLVDSVQTARLDRIFGQELRQKLAERAAEERIQFDNHVSSYHGDIQLIVSQKRFIDYVSTKRFSEKSSGVKHYSAPPPPWLPKSSIMRHMAPIQFALLLDGKGNVREVYHGAPDVLPQSLLQPANLLIQLSHNQSYMTSVDGRPFLLTAESSVRPDGKQAATLLLAQELNDEFLIGTHGLDRRDDIVALVTSEAPRVIASSRPELIPDGTALDTLKQDYLIAGKSFFDWGASDLVLEFTTFISRAEFARLNESVLKAQRQERIAIASVLICSFSLLMFWMTGRIRKLTRFVGDYSHRRLGMSLYSAVKGDQIAVLEDQYRLFIDEIEASRTQLKRQAEELLREKTVYLDNILQSSPVTIVAADLELRIKYYNAAAEQVFGYDSLFVIGKRAGELAVEGNNIHSLFKNALSVVGAGGAYADVAVMQGRGAVKYFDVAVHGIADNENILIGYLLIAHDITERLCAQKDLLLFRSLVDQSNDAFFVVDPETAAILDVNERACLNLEYAREALLALRVRDINPSVLDDASWQGIVDTVRRKQSLVWESVHKKKTGTVFPVELSVRIISQEGKDYLIAVARDITQRKKVEMELRIKDNAIAASINGIAISDMAGTVTYVNRSYVSMMGYADESEMLGKPLSTFVESPEQAERVKEALKTRGGWVGELAGKRKDGSLVPRLMSASIVYDESGVPISVMGSFVDITERKRAEASRLEYEQRFRAIFDAARDGIILVEQTRLVLANRAFGDMLGYAPEEATRLGITDIHPAQEIPRILADFESHMRGEKRISSDIPVKRKDDSIFYADISSALFSVGAQTYVVGIFRDTSERKKAEAQQREDMRRQKAILNNIPDMAWLKDRDGRFMAANEPFGKACGLSPEALIGKTDLDLWPRDLAERYRADDRLVMESGDRKQVEEPFMERDGKARWIETTKTPIKGDQGEVIGTTGIARDITDRKLAEEQIASSLHEKEILLREIHHRVKNNLQIISSLLYFQAKKVRDETGIAALREAQERLKSMILVHEKLYQSTDLARIDFGDYVRTLTDQMLRSYGAVRNKVAVTVEAGGLYLPIERALPCGMIINELLTNVFKYAYPGDMTGSALVRAASERGRLIIAVRDNGVGLPPDMDSERPETFGLQLVRNLTDQLSGTISFERNGGTTVMVDIPIAETTDRSGA